MSFCINLIANISSSHFLCERQIEDAEINSYFISLIQERKNENRANYSIIFLYVAL